MLWFILLIDSDLQGNSTFKYILCYGSSCCGMEADDDIDIFKYILCYGSSDNVARRCHDVMLFKYILCYGSSNTG